MVDPAPFTVKTPFAKVALPVVFTLPMSKSNQPAGNGLEVTAKYTGLLSFMLGAAETNTSPEVAPAGIVVLTELSLHELIVSGVPFKRTTPLP